MDRSSKQLFCLCRHEGRQTRGGMVYENGSPVPAQQHGVVALPTQCLHTFCPDMPSTTTTAQPTAAAASGSQSAATAKYNGSQQAMLQPKPIVLEDDSEEDARLQTAPGCVKQSEGEQHGAAQQVHVCLKRRPGSLQQQSNSSASMEACQGTSVSDNKTRLQMLLHVLPHKPEAPQPHRVTTKKRKASELQDPVHHAATFVAAKLIPDTMPSDAQPGGCLELPGTLIPVLHVCIMFSTALVLGC